MKAKYLPATRVLADKQAVKGAKLANKSFGKEAIAAKGKVQMQQHFKPSSQFIRQMQDIESDNDINIQSMSRERAITSTNLVSKSALQTKQMIHSTINLNDIKQNTMPL